MLTEAPVDHRLQLGTAKVKSIRMETEAPLDDALAMGILLLFLFRIGLRDIERLTCFVTMDQGTLGRIQFVNNSLVCVTAGSGVQSGAGEG